jgi:Putative intracellular protease/amidase
VADKRLQGTKVALVIAPEQFRDEELFTPRKKLEEAGAETTIAASKLNEAQGMLGGTAKPQALIKDLKAQELDGLVVVGGMGSPQYLWNDKDLHKLIQEMANADKVVASICLSGAVLANAGVLSGKKATVWEMPESVKALEDGKATYLNQPVVQDGKVITANGPEAAADFADKIIAELSKIKVS